MGASEAFDHQEVAEAWLSEIWASLREDGVSSVALVVDDEERYRMSLAEDEPTS